MSNERHATPAARGEVLMNLRGAGQALYPHELERLAALAPDLDDISAALEELERDGLVWQPLPDLWAARP